MNMFRTLMVCSSLALAACSSDPATPATDASTTTDTPAVTDTPATTDAPVAACYTQDSAAAVCPSTAIAQADPMRPSFRLTHIKISSPAALASPILGNVVNSAIHTGGFLWGVTFDLAGNMVRTGAFNSQMVARGTVGQGLIDGGFRYYSGNAPAMGGAATRWDPISTTAMLTGDRVSTGIIMGTVRLPIFNTDGSLLTELPLENARMTNVQLTADRKCIGLGAISGGRFNECTSNWQTADMAMPPVPFGRLEAVITAAAARTVRVESLMTTLCNLLAGSNCETTPQAMWTRQPDAMVNGEPGYALATEFSAISARIQ
jgi:hypothetical protein